VNCAEGPAVSGFLTPMRAFCLGVVILLGVQLGAAGLYFLGASSWFGQDTLTVNVGFSQIRGVEPKTRVRIQGLDAGEVTEIVPPGKPGDKVMLRLAVKGKYRNLVRQDSRVQILSEGLLGAKVVEILPPKVENSPPAQQQAVLQEEPTVELA